MNEEKSKGGAGLGPDAALGAAIGKLRERSRMNEAQLAERAELELDEVVAIEAADLEPTWGELRRIASALEVPLAELLAEAETLADRWGP
jgi:transcriptional regulator with XRE-family HTH domain